MSRAPSKGFTRTHKKQVPVLATPVPFQAWDDYILCEARRIMCKRTRREEKNKQLLALLPTQTLQPKPKTQYGKPSNVLYSILVYCIRLYWIVLHYVILYHITLYNVLCSNLYYTIVFCTILPSTPPSRHVGGTPPPALAGSRAPRAPSSHRGLRFTCSRVQKVGA